MHSAVKKYLFLSWFPSFFNIYLLHLNVLDQQTHFNISERLLVKMQFLNNGFLY